MLVSMGATEEEGGGAARNDGRAPRTVAWPRDDLDRGLGTEVAREDAGDDLQHLAGAAHHEAVPAALVARLGVLAPVRIGIEELEGVRPVVVSHLLRPEVRVECGDEILEPHRSTRSAAESDCFPASTGAKRSPCRATRPRTASIVKASGSSSSVSSPH